MKRRAERRNGLNLHRTLQPHPPQPDAAPAVVSEVGSETLAARVEREKNNIIPRDKAGNPSSTPRHSFDASKIPTTYKVAIVGKVFSGETAKERNVIAGQNIIWAAEKAQERAHILRSTGKLPEQFANDDAGKQALIRARGAAVADLMGWTVSADIIANYLVKDKTASP